MLELRISIINFIINVARAAAIFLLFLFGCHAGLSLLGYDIEIIQIAFLSLGFAVVRVIVRKMDGASLRGIYAQVVPDATTKAVFTKPFVSPFLRKKVKDIFNSSVDSRLGDLDSDLAEADGKKKEEEQEPTSGSESDDGIDLSAWGGASAKKTEESSKASRYAEYCLWGYAFPHQEDGLGYALAQAFVLFNESKNKVEGQIAMVESLNRIGVVAIRVIYVLIVLGGGFKFSISNVIMLLTIEMLFESVFKNSILYPALSHMVVSQFSQLAWDEGLDEKLEMAAQENSVVGELLSGGQQSNDEYSDNNGKETGKTDSTVDAGLENGVEQ